MLSSFCYAFQCRERLLFGLIVFFGDTIGLFSVGSTTRETEAERRDRPRNQKTIKLMFSGRKFIVFI